MRRPSIFIILYIGLTIGAWWLLFQVPGSVAEALWRPVQALLGTQHQLNSSLFDASEFPEPVVAAGRRLLQPLGMVRLVKIYEAPDPHAVQKPAGSAADK